MYNNFGDNMKKCIFFILLFSLFFKINVNALEVCSKEDTECFKKIDTVYKIDDNYYINDNLYTGIVSEFDNLYYIENGVLSNKSGLIIIKDSKYYLDKGLILTNTFKDNYYFGNNGVSLTGIQKIDDKYYAFSNQGLKIQTGFFNLDKDTYYVTSEGYLKTSYLKIGDNEYYFDKQGRLVEDLVLIDKKYYYFLNGKKIDNGLVGKNGKFYYLDNGTLEKNKWVLNQGYKYYIKSNGLSALGLTKIGKYYYYFGDDATLKYGLQDINDKIYYFNKDGKMNIKTKKINNQKVNFSKQGYIINSWVNYKNHTYYLKNDGTKTKGFKTLNNVKYFFDGEGKLIFKNAKTILDVSKHQNYIDWETVKGENDIDGVIIRLGYGTSFDNVPCVIDEYFEENLTALQNLNIHYDVYFYSYAVDRQTAKIEASFVVETLKKYNLKNVTVYYDLEENKYTKKLSKQTYEDIITTFVTRVRHASYDAYVYTYRALANSKFNEISINYVKWIAEYNDTLKYDVAKIDGWQYTSKGKIKGINGLVDISVWR